MSRFKKILLSMFAIILLVIVAGGGALYIILTRSMPDYSAAFTRNIEARVTVSRDARGVAHIRSDDFNALFFSQGYVHADERLWQMEFNRRVVQGRLAEMFGSDLVGADRFLRTLGLYRVARRVAEKTSANGIAVMEQYARGVNERINEGRLPPEFRILGLTPEPWDIYDITGILALMAFDLGGNWQEESIRLSLQEALDPHLFHAIMPPYSDWETPVIMQKEQALFEAEMSSSAASGLAAENALVQIEEFLPSFGSNSWVVSPGRWAGVSALLANDPHLSLSLPSIWFENSLDMEGAFQVYGWSIPGAPGVVIGHNDKIAWGMTNIGDTQDLFLERRDPDAPDRFFFDGRWYEAEVLEEDIYIKGNAEPEALKVIVTRNGPLISEDPAISLRWTAHHVETSTVDAVIGMNLAQNWDDFCDALVHFSTPVQNIVYADIHGNIGFKTAGLLPIRKQGAGLMPMPGWDGNYGWKGFIPFDELPELYNPPKGYIITANHRVAGDDYPYPIAVDDASPYRMMRIEAVLGSSDTLTIMDMKNLQTEWYNMHAAERLPMWLDLVGGYADREPEKFTDMHKTGLALLSDWLENPVSLPEKAAPAIYANWYRHLMDNVFQEKLGDTLYQRFAGKGYMAYKALDYLLIKQDSGWFDRGLDHMLAESYLAAMADLSGAFGSDPVTWQWQDQQTVAFSHVIGKNRRLRPFFNRGPFPYAGDYETVGRAAYSLNDPFNVNFAAGLRFIAVMDKKIDTYAVIAGGQSGHLMADHYDDQLSAWLAGQYYRPEFPW